MIKKVIFYKGQIYFSSGGSIPTKLSELTNDVGYITSTSIPTNVSAFTNDAGYLTSHQDISGKVNKAGDTMTGGLTCSTSGSNFKWGNITIYGGGSDGGINSVLVGSDVTLGDCNVGGMMGMKSTGTNTGIRLYDSSGNLIGGFQSTNGTPQWCNSSGTLTTISLDGHTHSYLPLSGGTLTGSMTAKFSGIDASKANNNVSSTQYPTTYCILDTSNRILSRLESVVESSGNIGTFMYVRNYNTSGSLVAQKGLKMTMNKSGALTWSIDDRLQFLKTLTAEDVGTSSQYFLTITNSWGKGGYCSVADAKTVLGLGNYLSRSGGTMTGNINWNGSTGYTSGLYWKENGYGDQFKIYPSFSGSDDDNYLCIATAVGGSGTTPSLTERFKFYPSGGMLIPGTLILSRTQDASGTANNKPALIIGGTVNQPHIEIDNNEIIAKSNATTETDLYLGDNKATLGLCGNDYSVNNRLNFLKVLTNENVGTSSQYFLTITDSWAKGGYCSVANAKSVLGLNAAAYKNIVYSGEKKPSNIFGRVAFIGDSPGVMEIGQYIDFHTDGSNTDYVCRLYAGSGGVLTTPNAFSHGSSRKIKKNIEPMTQEEADKILQLEAVKFDYIYNEDNNQIDRGFIAEDVYEILPDLVTPESYMEEHPEEYDETKTFNPAGLKYEEIIPYLVMVCKRQQNEIDILKSKLS